MTPVIYNFNNVCLNKFTNYICQFIRQRKLTDIYHSHDFYEIIIILNGSCTQIINGIEHHFDEDSLIILRPGDFHCFAHQSKDISAVSLSVGKEEFKSFLYVYKKELSDKIDSGDNPIIMPYINSASDLTLKCGNIFSNCNEYECKFLLSLIIKRYIDYTHKTENIIPHNLTYAVNEMKKPENLKVGISAFIALANYSRTQLSRLMKKYFDTTIHEYIFNLRMEYAYNALILTDDSIEEISENAGYASISHFNKIFKEKFKITPAALRKNHGLRTV